MKFKLLKHRTIAERSYFSGTLFDISPIDKFMDNGDLIYHYGDRWQRIPADDFSIVYSSMKEMEEKKNER